MPILVVLGIGLVLLSKKHEIQRLWNFLVIVLIWLNLGALVWRLVPQAHLLITYWNKLYFPAAPILHPLIVFGQNVVVNVYKLVAGMGV
ncbi:hypothetical protein Desaci_1459 [Desulfosporosinus acidiphilus SJ4]|uniref:Uncharacterized protein n=1 Tax=Desulfosporosinus acidiphilus (strain DSM 22704 / JCM 16185 / SJ4) TaxID=646529 RepID=I4D3V1_DESAJ|nr:hypothetical protein [Desulfosporosinus acidiphilus]AFM40475.1 hypothetical protein Desaci_1459 [Desulfosporosinus acidiphilus SJ4]